jgi:hypothetical protein
MGTRSSGGRSKKTAMIMEGASQMVVVSQNKTAFARCSSEPETLGQSVHGAGTLVRTTWLQTWHASFNELRRRLTMLSDRRVALPECYVAARPDCVLRSNWSVRGSRRGPATRNSAIIYKERPRLFGGCQIVHCRTVVRLSLVRLPRSGVSLSFAPLYGC